jgi:hypothetical protein
MFFLLLHCDNSLQVKTLEGYRQALLTIVLEVILMNRENSAECWNCNPATDAGASIPPSRGKMARLAITTASSLRPSNTIQHFQQYTKNTYFNYARQKIQLCRIHIKRDYSLNDSEYSKSKKENDSRTK